MNKSNRITGTGNYSGAGSEAIQKIADTLGIDLNLFYVHSIRVKEGWWNTAAKKRKQELKWTIDEQTTTTDGAKPSTKIKDKQQFMEGSSVHYPEFMIAKNETNSIEVTFARKPIEVDLLESFHEIIKDMPVLPKPRRRKPYPNGVAGELSTYDAHLAKLAWERETGYRNFDLNIAIKDYKYVTDSNLDLIAPFKPEVIHYIIGQDMYHVDNMAGHTTGGSHTLDVDGRITKVHSKAFAVSRDSIYKARKIAPVHVIWIPGNHDFLASYMLVFALQQHFRSDSLVTFDLEETPRKALLWGNLLIGWTHRIVGKHNTWNNELAQGWPELWGQSKFREWHHGDQHKKQDVKLIPVFTSGGVICRQITALSPVDKWHMDNVFTDAVPGGESFLWSKEEGVFANFMIWTGQYEENRNKIIEKHASKNKQSSL